MPPGSSPAPVRRRVDSGGGASGAVGEKGAARGLEPEADRDCRPPSRANDFHQMKPATESNAGTASTDRTWRIFAFDEGDR